MLYSSLTESFGQVGPELQLELEKLSNQIDREEDQASTSSAAPFMVCASHKLFGQIGSTLKLDLTHPQHYPLLLSPAMAIPLSTVLLELIYPLPDLLSIESAEFQTELKSQLSLPQRIIRRHLALERRVGYHKFATIVLHCRLCLKQSFKTLSNMSSRDILVRTPPNPR
ncbi:hypothetical protein PSHT_03582 [Puccinia striiformis]|uniref:Uncharacterized protein n=1 Tax=Puccinia striiformis TaxID=27350 RepID=A0A2S4WF63_9BASI|nr:hypothetical protein PSHT_03582 [Puccinia striiformis]